MRALGQLRRSRGSVILFVLGVVFLAAFLLSLLIARASGEFLVSSRLAQEAELRSEAYSALETTLAVLADFQAIEGNLHAPAQGWGDPLGHAGLEPPAGLRVEIAFDDESGRLPLATAEARTLQRYAEAVGVAPADAERLADALLAWTEEGHLTVFPDADPARYLDGPLPYAPPARPLRSFEELRAVAVARDLFFDATGQWTEVGERFRADASLHRFSTVNINSAPPSVLVALGLGPDQAIALVDRRIEPDGTPTYFESVAEAAAAGGVDLAGFDLGTTAQCLRIRIVVRRGATGVQLEAVVGGGPAAGSASGNAPPDPGALPTEPRAATTKRVDYPFRVLELRESPAPQP